MRRLLSDIRPAGVICYTIGHHVPVSLAAKMLGIPVVVHVGNAPPLDHNIFRKLRLVYKAGAPFVKMHLACSDVIASDCRNSYKLSNVQSVPNGIEISKFVDLRSCTETPAKRDSKHRVFGMVASLSEHKDQAVLIEAMSILQQRGGCQKLVLAGAGPELERLQKLAAKLGVVDRIDWLGNVNDVRPVLASLDLFAFATTRSEGLGIALVEAMSAGIPIVASDVPACREVLQAGRWGRLVAQRDATAWADALSSDHAIPVPPVEALARYDVHQTYRTYSQAINS
jgi:glycosyltransferase involved in cell wall biosynthesis